MVNHSEEQVAQIVKDYLKEQNVTAQITQMTFDEDMEFWKVDVDDGHTVNMNDVDGLVYEIDYN